MLRDRPDATITDIPRTPSKVTSDVITGAFDRDDDGDESASLCLFLMFVSTSTNFSLRFIRR